MADSSKYCLVSSLINWQRFNFIMKFLRLSAFNWIGKTKQRQNCGAGSSGIESKERTHKKNRKKAEKQKEKITEITHRDPRIPPWRNPADRPGPVPPIPPQYPVPSASFLIPVKRNLHRMCHDVCIRVPQCVCACVCVWVECVLLFSVVISSERKTKTFFHLSNLSANSSKNKNELRQTKQAEAEEKQPATKCAEDELFFYY